MATNANAVSCECPECGGRVEFAKPPLNGEVVRCSECSIELEVTSTQPLSVVTAPEVEEDWGE